MICRKAKRICRPFGGQLRMFPSDNGKMEWVEERGRECFCNWLQTGINGIHKFQRSRL